MSNSFDRPINDIRLVDFMKVEWEADGVHVVAKQSRYGIAMCKGDVNGIPGAKKVAKLIAAAPDMLEALKAALRSVDSYLGLTGETREESGQWWELSEALEAIIAKAEGRHV